MDIRKIIRETLEEAEYSYHQGDLGDVKTSKPYYSDNIAMMPGRDTGHFGSGMYFSTYNCKDWNYSDFEDKYGEYSGFKSNIPELIKIKDGVYRVDFELYKNLYKITSESHGKILFQTLREINRIFYTFNSDQRNPDIGTRYLKVKNNLEKIGLNIPGYREFLQMLIEGSSDLSAIRNSSDKSRQNISPEAWATMSTRIMMFNGYNGVNASGIPMYDNTTHGSVVYDMSKIDTKPREIKRPDMFCKIEKGVASSEYNDPVAAILRGEKLAGSTLEAFNNLPENEQLMLMKRYNKFMGLWIYELSPRAKEIYIKTLPSKIRSGRLEGKPSRDDIKGLVDYGLLNIIYNPNVEFSGTTFLGYILDELYNLDKEYMNKIIQGIPRKLSDEEKEFLEYYK